MIHSIHHVPGRLRVRSSAFRCQPAEALAAQRRLTSIDGVRQARLNAHAGSITIHYDPERITQQKLLDLMKDTGCTERVTPKANPAFARKAGELFGKALVGAVVNKAVERSAFRLVSVLL